MKKRILFCFGMCLLLCALTGCAGTVLPRTKDIASIELLRTLAVDAAPEGSVEVSVATGSGQGTKALLLRRSGETVSAACQSLQQSGKSAVFFGHTTECVVGEQLARAGIGPVLDYIQRDFEMRMDTPIFLARGRAGALLEETAREDLTPTDQLQEIGRELPLEERAWPCTVRAFLVDLYDNGYGLMPVVRIRQEPGSTELVSDGMGLFRRGKLEKILDRSAGMGAGILLNQPQAGYLDVRLEPGVQANLKLSGVRCRWRPRWTGDRLTALTAEVAVQADLTEVSDPAGSWEKGQLRELEGRLARHVTRQIQRALRVEQEEGDYLHLARQLMVQCPGRVQAIRTHWKDWQRGMELGVRTTATIRQSYDVGQLTA